MRNGEELLRAQAPGTLSIVPQAALSPSGGVLGEVGVDLSTLEPAWR